MYPKRIPCAQYHLVPAARHRDQLLAAAGHSSPRTRQLRWQQQLTSFMAEVSDLICPETAFDASDAEPELEHAES